jgi:uncharacterized protein YndB with AHSA1/START domain
MIDISRQINAVHRQVGARRLEAEQGHIVTPSQVYATDIDDLWDASTTAERIARWFLPIDGDLRLGGRFQLEGNAGGIIEACEPPRHFAATWEYGDAVSWIDVRLSPAPEGGTRFELQHTVGDDDHWEQFGPGAVGVGWDLALMGLALNVESGAAADPAEVAAWNTSPEGVAFMELSAQRWRDADTAGGTDAAVAAAAAERTRAAYAGDQAS